MKLELDDFVFEPTTWDLAFAIGLEPDESDRPALEELGDALVVHAGDDLLAELTPRAVEQLWSRELEQYLRGGLGELVDRGDEWTRPAAEALSSLERDGPGAEITTEVVQLLALRLSTGDLPPFHCFDCLEDAVAAAPPEDRRSIALQATLIGVHDADLAPEEVMAAVARRDTNAIATDERRRAVRRRLARLARFATGSLPALAAALAEIADESLPPDPKEDDVWQTLAATVLRAAAKPHLS